MKKIILAGAVCLALSSCATVLTPQRCEVAIRAASTVQEIAAVLISQGIEPERARLVAEAVAIGQLALAAACAKARIETSPVG